MAAGCLHDRLLANGCVTTCEPTLIMLIKGGGLGRRPDPVAQGLPAPPVFLLGAWALQRSLPSV